MSENWRKSEICIVINDKSQDSTAKHLSCDELLHFKFIIQFAGEEFFKSVNNGKVTGKMVDRVIHPFVLDFCPQRCRTRRMSKITCV